MKPVTSAPAYLSYAYSHSTTYAGAAVDQHNQAVTQSLPTILLELGSSIPQACETTGVLSNRLQSLKVFVLPWISLRTEQTVPGLAAFRLDGMKHERCIRRGPARRTANYLMQQPAEQTPPGKYTDYQSGFAIGSAGG